MEKVIEVDKVGKIYKLGKVGTGTLREDLQRWWADVRGLEDPYAKIATVNDRTQQSKNDEYVWALQDISFDIQKGDVVGVIGRNGAGKSTLLKILSRITAPSKGAVKIKGRVGSLLEVGTGFHPEMTGRENIFMNGTILGMRKYEITRKFDQIVDFAGVAKYIDTPVKRYSSGMMVRLGFAVAAFLEPEILIVDEVLAVGDAEFQKRAIGRMQEVSQGDGRTVIFVSHNLAAIDALCKRGFVIDNGRLVYSGDVKEALNLYSRSTLVKNYGKVEFTGLEIERFGNKQYCHLRSIELKSAEGQTINSFVMGQKMLINIEMEFLKTSDDYEIGVAVGNFHGTFPHYFVSSWEGFSSIKKIGPAKIEVEVPQVVLFPGEYTMSIWVAVRGAYYDDAVHNAITFTVIEGKVNSQNTYFERFSKNTQVYIKTNWKLN